MTCDNNNHLTIHPGSRLWAYGQEISSSGVFDRLNLSCSGREDVKIIIDHAALVQLVRDLVESNLVKVHTVFE